MTSRSPSPNPPPSNTVSQVLDTIVNLVQTGLPGLLWVRGEVCNVGSSGRQVLFFDLVERRPNGSRSVLPCALWNSNRAALQRKLDVAGLSLAAGQEMLFAGLVRLYADRGRLTFHVRDVVPEFTLGQVEARRRAVLAQLRRDQLIGRNARLPLGEVPLHLALLTSRSGAALTDFLKVLEESGYAFTVDLWEIPVQGSNMENIVGRTLNLLARKQSEQAYDAACIVRGGGSTTDLGWWDSYPLCAAVAHMPLPVLTGIGHERDRLAIEEVVWKALSTPTAAAQFFCQTVAASDAARDSSARELARLVPSRLARAIERLTLCRQAVCEGAGRIGSHTVLRLEVSRSQLAAHVRRCLENGRARRDALAGWLAEEPMVRLQREQRQALDRLRQAVAVVGHRVYRCGMEVGKAKDQLGPAALRGMAGAARRCQGAARSLRVRIEEVLATVEQRTEYLRALVEAHDLGPLLRRGFSLTFDIEGRVIRSAAVAPLGTTLITRLADGEVRSVVMGNLS